jgi:hypothetical protein
MNNPGNIRRENKSLYEITAENPMPAFIMYTTCSVDGLIMGAKTDDQIQNAGKI